MAFIIPNANVTGSGQRFVNVNQAEPDSLDIEALGLRSNWIRSGGEATISSGVLSVAAGVAVIGGTPYSFGALTPSPTLVSGVDPRFDLVIVRLTGSTAAVQVINGEESATNPVLPQSRSTLEDPVLGFASASHVDPATDVLIAAIYVTDATPTTESLVDKRIMDASPVTRTAASAPSNSTKDVVGDVVVYDEDVYVKINSTTWDTLLKSSDSVGFPIGSVFAWASNSDPNPVGKTLYLACDGSSVSTTTYAALYAVIGSSYGSAGAGSFNLPNLNDDRTIFGSSTVGTSGGSNSVTLTTAQLPTHKHDVAVANHSALQHGSTETTTSDSTKSTFNSKTEQDHTHPIDKHQHKGALVYRRWDQHNGLHVHDIDENHDNGNGTVSAFHVDVLGVNETSTTPTSTEGWDSNEYNEATDFENSSPTTTKKPASGHNHSIDINHHPVQTHSVSESNVGSGSSVDTKPKFLNMRWFIRVA